MGILYNFWFIMNSLTNYLNESLMILINNWTAESNSLRKMIVPQNNSKQVFGWHKDQKELDRQTNDMK